MKGGMSLVSVSSQAMYRVADTTPLRGRGIVLKIGSRKSRLRIKNQRADVHDNHVGLFRVFLQKFAQPQVPACLFSVGLQLGVSDFAIWKHIFSHIYTSNPNK
jgi:hypothetical protein